MSYQFTNPLTVDLMKGIVDLELAFQQKEGFDFQVVVAAHIQLLAIALVAVTEGNFERIEAIKEECREILFSLTDEQVEEFAKKGLVKGNDTVN